MLRKVVVIDGGFGSELERRGVLAAVPEDLNLTDGETVRSIHRAYAMADIITTNSFGLNRIKYRGKFSIKEVAEAAISNARTAGKKVFFDIGPTGGMMQPLGTLTFEEAFEAFSEIAACTKELVDGYIVETFSDLLELKACILALKEQTEKPIFATMTFDQSCRTLNGTTPEIAAALLENLGVSALGVNCSLGPRELKPVVERFLSVSHLPVIVQPNRGIPTFEDGKTVYSLSVEDFMAPMEEFIQMGVSVVGGCCGTTPEFTARLAKFSGKEVEQPEPAFETVVTSSTRRVVLKGARICGERLNPTGKKKLKEALLKGDMDYLAREAIAQEEAGAELLDLNVGVPGLDEPAVMERAAAAVAEATDLPLQIDSSDPKAIEAGILKYSGVPLVNSVNGEGAVMDAVFPLVKKYGAVVLGLTMDRNGVPRTAEERLQIAERILSRAEEYGIPRHRVMIDTLVLTASAEQPLVKETLKALSLVRNLGVQTALGVSNVSFGLPDRPRLNRAFLAAALQAGLTMPIMNPMDGEMSGTVYAFRVLSGEDEGAEDYISRYAGASNAPLAAAPKVSETASPVFTLSEAVRRGRKGEARALTEEELQEKAPMDVVNGILIPALEEVGRLYDRGTLYLPQLIAAAEAAKEAFAVLGEKFERKGAGRGKVVLATVKGDVHDIGKNICKVVLESYGFEVTDLGKDVPIECVVQAVQREQPLCVGLSALMTTTVPNMRSTIEALRAAGCKIPVFAGGAVLNEEIAKEIGADYYTANALELVKTIERELLK
ncbi:MAG TPA: homocysteine S-methyltransferase family protein [Candidatus Gallimonas gallistercoris]|uniref:Methionine synthase n=1 Tax=Candidatus Gallimonas gallistercoris TaxID=2838602 RepID=A0A9D2KGW5_9FIRM|nr:homocysteine S-methyltransferase family protein [Candidatus Gallimonas gallistercoris]